MIPKFRVFIKETITETDEMKDVILISFKSKLVRTNDEKWYGFEDAVLMQSTGLHDKNGVEIYEGDIVNYAKSFTNPMTGAGSISINKNLRIIFKDAEFVADGIDIRLKKIVSHMDVIGNIFEDGELLEGADR